MSNLHSHEIVESVGHEGRGTTVATIECFGILGDEDNEIPLSDAIEALRGALNEIPEPFRDSAVLRIYTYEESSSAYANVTFTRPETDNELAARKAWLDSLKNDGESRDRREYERLKAKFG